MNNVRHFIVFFIALFFSISLYGQQLKENEVVVIKGEKFVLHQVRTGETIFSISKDFQIEQSQLLESNPGISEQGLDIGEILKIPFKEGVNPQYEISVNRDPTGFITHEIESRKETPYFIAKEYGITVEQLYAYNPEVNRYRKGTEVRIPQWDKHEEHSVSDNQTQQILENVEVSKAEELGKSEHYFEHVIVTGETMWGITHKYNVSDEELIALNPALETGFPAGVLIKIPVKDVSAVNLVDNNLFYTHKVQPDETLYGLARKYNTTIDEIKQNNPVLANRGPVIGEILIIPKPVNKPIENAVENIVIENEPVQSEERVTASLPEVMRTLEVPGTCVPEDLQAVNRYYTVSLFLPLYLEANDTLNREIILPEVDSILLDEIVQDTAFEQDTVIEEEKSIEMFKQFYGNSENFLQFYEGVLIAIDSLQKTGVNVILHVFDTQNNVDTTRSFIKTPAFRRSDLIIGPVYQEIQGEVAAAAANYRIPMISPVANSSNVINQNPYFFQVNPSREYLVEKTAEMVLEDYYRCNFIVVRTSNIQHSDEEKLVEIIREKYFNAGILNSPGGVTFTEYNIRTEGTHGLRTIMSKQKENVVLIPSSLEGELSIAISNINNLADDYPITLIATSNYQQRYPSIDIEQYHNLKMKYVYPYWVDYSNPSTVKMIGSFKRNFDTEPGMFGMQGFDVTYYFLNALRYYGSDFGDCISYFHLPLVQGNYHFQKVSQQGGYMNQGVSVISYTRDYNVLRQRTKGQPKLVVAQSE